MAGGFQTEAGGSDFQTANGAAAQGCLKTAVTAGQRSRTPDGVRDFLRFDGPATPAERGFTREFGA
jgi:hypothetical protein